jgi:hypothetical protein
MAKNTGSSEQLRMVDELLSLIESDKSDGISIIFTSKSGVKWQVVIERR